MFTFRCSKFDPAETAIHPAERVGSVDSEFAVVPQGVPLNPWKNVASLIEEWLSYESFRMEGASGAGGEGSGAAR